MSENGRPVSPLENKSILSKKEKTFKILGEKSQNGDLIQSHKSPKIKSKILAII